MRESIMRPLMHTMLIAGLALAGASCSKGSADRDTQDVHALGGDVSNATHATVSNPAWGRAKDDLARLGHDVGQDLRAGAETTRATADKVGQDIKSAPEDVHRRRDQADPNG